jgi:hypothetical protein
MRSELRRSRLPRARREGAKVVTVRHPRHTGEDIFHIGHRAFAVALARDDERVQDGRALARGVQKVEVWVELP